MRPLIRKVRKATEAEWDSIWSACEYATYFHSREWADIWHRYTRGKVSQILPEPQLIEFSDHKRVIIPQSYRYIMRRFLPKIISTPAGCYGGWISNDDLNVEHVAAIVRYLTSSKVSCSMRLNPFDVLIHQINYDGLAKCSTQAIALGHNLEDLKNRAKSSHRQALRKARRHNLTVEAVQSYEEWSRYYDLYKETTLRWGDAVTLRYSFEFFKILYELRSPYIKLWVAKKGGTIVSGIVCLYARKGVSYWHGATGTDYFRFRPVNLLFDEVIRDAVNSGLEWLDLGASGSNEGVWRFKESLGAYAISYPAIEKRTLPDKMISLIKAA